MITQSPPPAQPGPLAAADRVTNLDAIRGLSVLGILLMNSVSFGLMPAAYFNLSAGGSRSWLDKAIGAAGEVFVDQKTMGLFSMLFGAGIVLFADRAAAKSAHPVRLVLWRNVLLLLIGFLHGLIWEGDVLFVYAVCAPLLVWARHLRPRRLIIAGSGLVLWSAVLAAIVQTRVPSDGAGLGDYWLTDGSPMSDAVGLFLLNDFFARSLGMMLIGIALYRLQILQGVKPAGFYHRLTAWGLGIGLPIAIAGVAIQLNYDFDPRIAVIGEAPNTIATIPITLGYLGLITLWNQRPTTRASPSARHRTDGFDQLPHPDPSGRHRASFRQRSRDPRAVRHPGLRPGGLGAAGGVVEAVARPLPIRSGRVAVAQRDLPPPRAASHRAIPHDNGRRSTRGRPRPMSRTG